jgi:hypothetical protein
VGVSQIAETTGSQELLELPPPMLEESLVTLLKIVQHELIAASTIEPQDQIMTALKDASGQISLALAREDQIAQPKRPGAISLLTLSPEAPIQEAQNLETMNLEASASLPEDQIVHGNQELLLREDLLQDRSVQTHASMTETVILTVKTGFLEIVQGMRALLALAIRIQTEKLSLRTRF